MKNKIHDVVVVGGGPAGITASIYLVRMNFSVLLICDVFGGQATLTAGIENYSGFRFISGMEFAQRLSEHVKEYNLSCTAGKVISIKKSENIFEIKTEQEEYKSRAVLIASGARQKELGIKGEKEFLNKGVAYCTVCDAPLFKNRKVAIIGGGNSAMEAALHLESYASKIYLVTKNKELQGEKILIEKVKTIKNVEIVYEGLAKEIKGGEFVKEILVKFRKEEIFFDVEGVFIEIGYQSNSDFFIGKKNSVGEIMIDKKNKTSVKGIFSAGDVTDVPIKQIIVAAGEGAKAALFCGRYLSRGN